MTTILDLVSRSLRLIGVAAEDEPVSAGDANEALAALNDVSLRYGGAEASLTDNYSVLTFEDRHRLFVTHIVAAELAGQRTVPIPAIVAARAAEGDALLRSEGLTINPLNLDRSLKDMPSRHWGLYRSRRS